MNACALRDPKLRCDRKKLGISTQPIYQSGRHVQEAVQTPDRDQEDSDNNGGNVVHSRYVPGDMQHMFEQIVDRFSHKYPVTVLSTSPYLVIFDNFTTPAEGDALVALPPRWERSTDTGTMNEYGESGMA
ncbi:hypothetical protein EON64_02825 [archaeon]|nr:MAG: hypothetical protein EON64_02825 [archaeon]